MKLFFSLHKTLQICNSRYVHFNAKLSQKIRPAAGRGERVGHGGGDAGPAGVLPTDNTVEGSCTEPQDGDNREAFQGLGQGPADLQPD